MPDGPSRREQLQLDRLARTSSIRRSRTVKHQLNLVCDHRLSAAYVLALYLGMRRGEMLGLRWGMSTWTPVSCGSPPPCRAQTGSSSSPHRRHDARSDPVPLPAVCIEALRERKSRQNRDRLAAYERWEDWGLVFSTAHGTPIEPRTLNRHWYGVRERAGLTARFHDLRHACVTLLLGLGVPPHVVRDIVGHSALDVTMDIYAHVDLTEKRAALDKLGTLLAG